MHHLSRAYDGCDGHQLWLVSQISAEKVKLMYLTPGHLFCHGCLMEALIAGEQQEAEPGKFNSRCPVCRKKVSRPKPGAQRSEIIPLELKFSTNIKRLKVSITD